MKLRTFSCIMLIVGVALAAVGAAMPLCVPTQGATGIIGGADGYTYRRLMFNWLHGMPLLLVLLGAALTVSALFCLLFTNTVRKHCQIRTSLISLSLSAVGGAGLVCALEWFTITALSSPSIYPIAYPVSVFGGAAALVLFIGLIALYFSQRGKCWSVKGVVIDVLTSILYLPGCFWAVLCFSQILR